PQLLRRLRAVRRLRFTLRRVSAGVEDRRPAGSVPAARVRGDEHQPLAARRAAPPNDPVRILEVQDRPLPPVELTGRRTRAAAHARSVLLPTVLALAVVLAAGTYFLAKQPLGSPWWIYADADSTYTASSINLLTG